MRKSRKKIKKEYEGKTVIFIISFWILLPAISIYLGYCAHHFILSNISKDPIKQSVEYSKEKVVKTAKESNELKEIKEVKQKKEVKEINTIKEDLATLKLEGFDIYSVQVGNFATEDNAKKIMEELSTRNMGAYIWENNGYKVVTMSMLDRESVDCFAPKIKELYNEAFVTTRSIPTKIIKYKKEDEKEVLLLQKMNNGMMIKIKELTQIIKDTNENPKNIASRYEDIKKHIIYLNELENELQEIKTSENMQVKNKNYIEIIDAFKNELEMALKQKEEQCFSSIQSAVIKGTYEYSNLHVKSDL